ncbi:MAG: AraC family transcriptional regulator [Spirochaetales bacterium]|nr:AraC family transcriptional regulator [Spirochaetales bacterium]
MSNLDYIYKALEIIEENLRDEINVYDVSEGFGFSLYYFSRIFKGVTGYNLKEYILSRKISEACTEVLDGEKNIVDIAFDYGFGSHESFSRAFFRITGMNPSEARRLNRPIPVATFPPLTRTKLENRASNSCQKPEEVILDEIILVGIPFYYNLAYENDLSKPWGNLVSNVSLIESRLLPERYFQLQYWFPEQEPDMFYFFIAVQADSADDIPIQFTVKTIPRQKYLKFLHKGRANTVGRTYQYIYENYLPESNYRLPHLYNFEYYGKGHLGPFNDESVSEIYIPVN